MPCDLTVVVAHVDSGALLPRALTALDEACSGVNAEIVVVQTAAVSTAPPPCRTPLTTLRVSGEALVPQLWAQGAAIARGECVAFTLANCEVSRNWAQHIVAALKSGAAGVAGPLACGADVDLVNRAIYYLRYSAFLPERVTDTEVSGEIPGDNAAYRRDVLTKHSEAITEGFWEVLFHRHLRRDGGILCTRRGTIVRFTGGIGLMPALRHRFAHGRHFGAWRAHAGLRRPWQIVAAAALVPALLTSRAAARVLPLAEHRWKFLASCPVLFVVACAWAFGEAVGAVSGAGLPMAVVSDHVRAGVA